VQASIESFCIGSIFLDGFSMNFDVACIKIRRKEDRTNHMFPQSPLSRLTHMCMVALAYKHKNSEDQIQDIDCMPSP